MMVVSMRRIFSWPMLLSLSACAAVPMPPQAAAPSGQPSPQPARTDIVVIGDTQRTSPIEELVGREQNEPARLALIEKIAQEERPAFVVHLGDMVESGASAEQWRYFDRLVSALSVRNIPILPVLGNHDYWGDDRTALGHATERFPRLASRFYAAHSGALGLIWLDSNLQGRPSREQTRFLASTLCAFDHDRTIRAVLVFTHHPPYTNGRHRHGEPYVIEHVLPLFFASKKARVLLSGHVHGYERFEARGKTFVVTGGGGGPRVEYDQDSPALHAVFHADDPGKRAFNYVVIERGDAELRFTVKCLVGTGVGCSDQGVLDTFRVPLAPRETADDQGAKRSVRSTLR